MVLYRSEKICLRLKGNEMRMCRNAYKIGR